MVNITLIVWATFIGVFGWAIGNWWFSGGFKKWLKYKHDLQKEKERLAEEYQKAEERTDKHLKEFGVNQTKTELGRKE